MNNAHWHLVLNHLPVVGLLIGTLILIAGLLMKKSEVKLTALAVLVFTALTSIAAFYTGEGAEEVVENIAGISETLIHNHEEAAEIFFTVTLILGSLSLLAFILEFKKLRFAKYAIYLVLLVALSDGILAKNVGTSGGEIRHSEIRDNANVLELGNETED